MGDLSRAATHTGTAHPHRPAWHDRGLVHGPPLHVVYQRSADDHRHRRRHQLQAAGCPTVSPQAQAESCPGCNQIEGVEQTSSTARVTAWKCTRCQTSWAMSLVNAHLRDRAGDYAEQVGAARWILQQIVQLVDQMPELTDRELRTRLLALAEASAPW